MLGNLFVWREVGVRVLDGGRATLSGNAFLYDKLANLPPYRLPGATPPLEAVPVETPAQRAAREADDIRIRYGVKVGGAGSSVRCEENLFAIRRHGDAVHVEKGGTAVEGNGNEYVGKGAPRSSED